jgi:hypothetical protein
MECIHTNPGKRPEAMQDVTRRLEIIEHSWKRRAASEQASQGSKVRVAVS